MAELLSRPPFPGFRPEAFAFLRALAENNDRDWFKARKDTYEAELKDPLELLLTDGARRLAETDLPLQIGRASCRERVFRAV